MKFLYRLFFMEMDGSKYQESRTLDTEDKSTMERLIAKLQAIYKTKIFGYRRYDPTPEHKSDSEN